MTILGNLFLIFAAFVFLLLNLDTFRKPSRGGDALVGYYWAVLIAQAAISVCVVLTVLIIAAQDGWEWVAPTSSMRLWRVILGTVVVLLGSALLSFREGVRVPRLLRGLIPLPIPILLFVGLAILLNGGKDFRLPLLLAAGLGAIPCAFVVLMPLKRRVEGCFFRLASIGKPSSNDQRIMDDIEAHDAAKNGITRLLVFTDANHRRWVREPAVAKIRAQPDWQQQLIKQMTNPRYAYEVFTFLASNEVDDRSLFAEPLHAGVLTIADSIRQNIEEVYQSHHLYKGQFKWEVDRVLRTLQKFEGNGHDYRPEVLALRKAFDARCKIKKPEFTCLPGLDAWLRKKSATA